MQFSEYLINIGNDKLPRITSSLTNQILNTKDDLEILYLLDKIAANKSYDIYCDYLQKEAWKVIPEFEEFEDILKEKGYYYHIDGLNLIINEDGYIDLSSLTALPENIQFNNEGSVFLDFLTSLPENIQFNNEGSVFLDFLTSLPESTQFNNRGNIWLDSLPPLPENKYEIFKNRGLVYYGGDDNNWKKFNPHIREASLKFAWKNILPYEERNADFKQIIDKNKFRQFIKESILPYIQVARELIKEQPEDLETLKNHIQTLEEFTYIQETINAASTPENIYKIFLREGKEELFDEFLYDFLYENKESLLKFSWRRVSDEIKEGDIIKLVRTTTETEVLMDQIGTVLKIVDNDSLLVDFSDESLNRWWRGHWWIFLKPDNVQLISKKDASLKVSDQNELQFKNQKMFENRYNSYGDNGANMFWSSPDAQTKRFDEIFQFLGNDLSILNNSSLLDVGCGYADILNYLQKLEITPKYYVGIDIVPSIIEVAQQKHPKVFLETRDITEKPFSENKFDYVIGSGIFALEHDRWEENVISTLKEMLKTAKKAVSVNFLKNGTNKGELHFVEPDYIKKLIEKHITKNLKISDNYLPDDFTVYLFK